MDLFWAGVDTGTQLETGHGPWPPGAPCCSLGWPPGEAVRPPACWARAPPKPASLTGFPPSLLHSEGSNLTPAHHFQDFRFKTYAPVAFRYFRELFGIRPDDYLVSTLGHDRRVAGSTAGASRGSGTWVQLPEGTSTAPARAALVPKFSSCPGVPRRHGAPCQGQGLVPQPRALCRAPWPPLLSPAAP